MTASFLLYKSNRPIAMQNKNKKKKPKQNYNLSFKYRFIKYDVTEDKKVIIPKMQVPQMGDIDEELVSCIVVSILFE